MLVIINIKVNLGIRVLINFYVLEDMVQVLGRRVLIEFEFFCGM